MFYQTCTLGNPPPSWAVPTSSCNTMSKHTSSYCLNPCSCLSIEANSSSPSQKNTPHFTEPRDYITVFITACHLSIFWVSSSQSTLSHFILRSTLISSYLLSLCPSRGVFPSHFLTWTSMHLSSPTHTCHIPCTSRHLIIIIKVMRNTIIKLLTVQFSPVSCYFPIRQVKYLPQHPILKHPLSLSSSLNVKDQVSHPHKTGKIICIF